LSSGFAKVFRLFNFFDRVMEVILFILSLKFWLGLHGLQRPHSPLMVTAQLIFHSGSSLWSLGGGIQSGDNLGYSDLSEGAARRTSSYALLAAKV